MSLGLALWAAAAILKVVGEYLMATPLPLHLFRPLEKHSKPLLEKHKDPVSYNLLFLFLLALFALTFVFLLSSAIKAYRVGLSFAEPGASMHMPTEIQLPSSIQRV